ncbi:MAG: hypothetical protein P4M15_08895 [Alphaproteobacteria bacterium]|nr:hypothetical protein [Alphaproteobacteria bacterium]
MSPDIGKLRADAAKGNREARINLGLCYLMGWQMPQNIARGWELLRAAEPENAPRLLYIEGVCLAKGIGRPLNERSARAFFRLAAEQGFGPAEYNYAAFCFEGRGGPCDAAAAALYFARAEEHGIEAARPWRKAATECLPAPQP